MPLGKRNNVPSAARISYEAKPVYFEDLIARMIKDEVQGILEYEKVLEAADSVQLEPLRNAIKGELQKILRDERNHALMLRAIQDKLYENRG
jgi:rubrerythrin